MLADVEGQAVLVVEDDGVGFDPPEQAEAASGFGLAGIQERAGLVGATVQIESTPGKGTSVFVRLRHGGPPPP